MTNDGTTHLKTDLAYVLVALGSTTIWSVLSGWLLYFYLPPAGEGVPLVPAVLFSIALFANRIIDAVIDPPIGYLSDHTRSRWGRRRPFMLAAALPMLVCFVLLWTPPVPGESIWNLIYVVVVLELYNVAYSFLHISYEALLPELAPTDQHRVRISAWSAGFQIIAMILGSLAGVFIEMWGYARMALVYAVAMLPFFYGPILVLRERSERQIAPAQRQGFWQSLVLTWRNPAFRVYTITWALYWATMTLVPIMIPFVATEICHLTKSDAVYFYMASVLASLVCYPLITWLANRLGKWIVYTGSLLASAVVLSMLFVVGPGLPGGVPVAVQGIAWAVLGAIAVSGAVVLSPALAAEITDYDERLTGQRREGSYYAAWGLLDNVVSGAASALVPLLLLLGRSQSDPQGPLGVRMIGVVGGALMLAAFVVFWRYPLRRGQGIGG
ncbi:MAG: MFS transporter [Chloroflexi bacterium]|nr:MFS transporter [Chloroflexota bacterium]MBU1750722.1 MFS transporter [Chloroflexota bacterium]MBU1878094.1 MFS transporter [Chloroflexota bacterium]